MVVTSTSSRSFALLCERPLSAKRFILGSGFLDCSIYSLRSKSCAGLFMRAEDRNHEEKTVLLEQSNEGA